MASTSRVARGPEELFGGQRMVTQMSGAEEWREHIAELRQLAEQTADVERHQKLLELADQWEEFAEELGRKDS
jgi:hypothetical protein